jgi:AhpD family alkylhydroperoxidase
MYEVKNLSKVKTLADLTPEAMEAFRSFEKIALRSGVIPKKYKEIMALAVAFTTQCSYCIHRHNQIARASGATAEEIAETAMVRMAVRSGGALTHATHCF